MPAPRIVVIGLGYVGLPLAVALARKFDAWTMVDDCHATGHLGERMDGAGQAPREDDADDDREDEGDDAPLDGGAPHVGNLVEPDALLDFDEDTPAHERPDHETVVSKPEVEHRAVVRQVDHFPARRQQVFAVLEQLMKHPLTDIGLKKFLDDWAKSGAKI